MKKTVLIILAITLLLTLLTVIMYKAFIEPPPGPKQVNLTYWGLVEDEETIKPIIEQYQTEHPFTKITYVKQSSLNYRTRLQTQLRNKQGPDIFTIHSSWVKVFRPDIVPAGVSSGDLAKSFYPVIKEALTVDNQVLALPTEVDGLAMFYNEDILRAANVSVPKTWQEFIVASQKVTVKSKEGVIQTAGAAMGSFANVDYWPELIGLLYLQQPEANLLDPGSRSGIEVLQFYRSFSSDPGTKIWDQSLQSSTKMFANEKLAFYFAPARRIKEIREINPNLRFKIAPVPQLPDNSAGWGSFWAETVSVRSPNQAEAWDFLTYLTSAESLKKLNQQRAARNLPAKPYPRIDMANEQLGDSHLGAFVLQGPIYKTWFLNSDTHDAGLNDEMIGVFDEFIRNTGNNENLPGKIQTVINKYTNQVGAVRAR